MAPGCVATWPGAIWLWGSSFSRLAGFLSNDETKPRLSFRLPRGEGNLTPEGVSYMVSRVLFLGVTLVVMAGTVVPQEPSAPAPSSQQAPAYKTAMKWKRFDYTCEGGQKLVVFLHDQTVKVRFKDSDYL